MTAAGRLLTFANSKTAETCATASECQADIAVVVETSTQDRVNFRYTANKEIVADASAISDDICIAPGEYAFDDYGLDLSLNHDLEDFGRDNSFCSSHADLTLKLSYTFRSRSAFSAIAETR